MISLIWYEGQAGLPLWVRYIQALLSLVQCLQYCALIGRKLFSDATPALICHKEPAQGTQSPLLGTFLFFFAGSLWHKDRSHFHARKESLKAWLCLPAVVGTGLAGPHWAVVAEEPGGAAALLTLLAAPAAAQLRLSCSQQCAKIFLKYSKYWVVQW